MYHYVNDKGFLKQSPSCVPRRSPGRSSPHNNGNTRVVMSGAGPHPRRSGTPRLLGGSTSRPITIQHHGSMHQGSLSTNQQQVKSGTPLEDQQQYSEVPRRITRDPPLRRVHFAPSEEYGPALDIPELNVKPNNRLAPLQELMVGGVGYDADGDREASSKQDSKTRRKRPRHSRRNRYRRLGNGAGVSENTGELVKKKAEKKRDGGKT